MMGAPGIFAKTVGVSPVKTRLAASIGVARAESFYRLSVDAVADIAQAVRKLNQNRLTPYWAVGESDSVHLDCWKSFKAMWTGDGGLGQRLHTVYSTLLKTNDYVVMIGTDSPQLQPDVLIDAIERLESKSVSCVIGPCLDGGFYLFASRVPIPEVIWMGVEYSQSTTLTELADLLTDTGMSIDYLDPQGDVDTVDDLARLADDLAINDQRLPAQDRLAQWFTSA